MGVEYELTRHNIGFLALDMLADKLDVTFEPGRYADVATGKFKGRTLQLIKPTTYMNLSGKAVNYWLTQSKVSKENLLVVTDDLALPFGKLRMRAKGSDAGHNGLKNIDQVTGGNNYARLRIGIGNEFAKGKQVDYVLSRFEHEEMDALTPLLERAIEMMLSYSTIGIVRTMNTFN